MLILSRVCAEFRDRNGTVVHRVTPQTRLTFQEAPESIREDPLFQMLVNDGSLEAAVTPVRKKRLEAEPLRGTDATGKRAANPEPEDDAPSGKPERRASGRARQEPESEKI
jgi:hypothetical protein